MLDKDEGITSQVYEVSPSGVQRLVVMQRECLLQPCLDPRARICITARVSTSAKLWPGNQRRVIKAGLIHTCTLPEFGQQAHFLEFQMKVQVYKTLQGLRLVLEAYTQLQATPRDIQDYFGVRV